MQVCCALASGLGPEDAIMIALGPGLRISKICTKLAMEGICEEEEWLVA